ncbi:MAG: hypothetical protein JM58_09490 [Peptococcaceae bacterium BICA1-8]|nr:MAG: hypothetical protein JM58_09490 [Peptococcaceae bacterium BICA1-8]
MDKIVGERLAREKAKYADYEDIKAITEDLQAFGYKGTPQEVRQAIKEQREQMQKQTELDELQTQAKIEGTSPELLKKISDLETKLSKFEEKETEKTKQEEAKKKELEQMDTQIEEFNEKHADIDLEKLSIDPKFKRFYEKSNPKLTLVEVYEEFVDLIGGVESETMAKIRSNIERSTSSGKAKNDSAGATHGLTQRQQALAKNAGMSFKDYSDLLKDIM